MNVVSEVRLVILAATIFAYVTFTFRGFTSRKRTSLMGRGFYALCVIPIVSPGVALYQSSSLECIGVVVLLWFLWVMCEAELLQRLKPENKMGVFLLVPLMRWVYGVPLGLVAYLPYRLFFA